MKKINFKWLLLSIILSIASINAANATDYYLRYMKDMPSGYYDGNTSQKLTRFGSTNRYYCELDLSGSSSYGFFIRLDNSNTKCWKADATASTNQEIELYSYSGTDGGSPHRITYTTGSAGTYIFTYDIDNHKISVSPKSSQTVKVAWSIASGHDGDYDLGTYTTLSQEGSSSLYSADVDLTAVKHYMFVQTDNNRYWKNTATMSAGTYAYVYDYGTNNYGDSGNKNNFTPSAAGKYRFTWDHDAKMVKYERVYSLVYNGNGSSSGTVPGTTYHPSGANVTVASNSGSLSKSGYAFVGWNTAANGSGKFYAAGSTITTSAANTTLYAMWLQVHSPSVDDTYYGEKLTKLDCDSLYEVYRYAVSSNTVYVNAGTASAPATSGTRVLFSISGSGSSTADSTYTWSTWMAHTKNYGVSAVTSTSSKEFPGSQSVCYPTFRKAQGFILAVTGYSQFSLYGKDGGTSSDKRFHVYINDVDVTASLVTGTTLSSTLNVRRYNLTPGIVSVIRVVGNTNDNNQSQGFSLRLNSGYPKPTAFSCSSVTSSSATLSITDGYDTNDYEFYYSTSSTAPTSGTTPTTTSTALDDFTKSPTISGLTASTSYYIWVRSKCSSTCKSDWKALSGGYFTTSAGGCTSVSAPTGLSCSSTTKNSLTFSWTAASNASSYDVYLYTDSECSSEASPTESNPQNVTTTSATFTGLTAGTTYYCKVQSKGDGETYCESGGTTSAQSGTTKTVHSISFDANGGSGSLSTISGIEYGSSQKLTAIGSSITRTGWTFTGWNTDKYGGGTAYADQATVASVTSNITLYAQWSKTVYLKMGQSWDADNAWFAIYYYDSANDKKNGWVAMSLAESCSSPAVYTATIPGNGYNTMIFVRKNPASATLATWDNKWNQTTNQTMPTSNNQFTITGGSDDSYTGSWGTYSAPTYTISYNKGTPPTGSAAISGSKSNQTKNCGVDFTLPNVVFTLAGYTQDGWATSNGGSKAYNLGGSYTTESSQTFYPHWSANQYSVSHSLTNASASDGATGSNAATCGTNYTAVFAAADGYTLPASITVTIGGNSTTAGTEYTWTKASGTVVVNGAYITGNVAITVAGIIKKTVTYKKNGGASGADGSVTGSTTDASSPYEHGSTVTTIANGFTNSGYKFKWWNTAYDGSGEDFYVGEKFNITANALLYAQWESVGSDEAFWVGNPNVWHATTHDVTVGDMNIKPQDYSSNNNAINKDFTGDNKVYTIVNATEKRAIVMAVGASDKYVEISFTDGSTINELEVGVAAKDGTDPTMAVLYSTTSDFSSGLYYLATPVIPTIAQTSKQVTTVNPDVEDTYKYVRIYSKIYTAVYSQTGGSGNKLRIYSIKAKKGASCTSLDAPEGLSCTAQTKNSLTFGWSAVTNASSYDVYLYSDEDCTAEVTPTEGKPYNVTGTSATLTGLDAGTTYYCQVRTKGNGSTYCTNGAITTTAASGKTKYSVTYAGNSATSGSVPTDANSYASGDEVTVAGNTGSLVKTGYTFRGWTSGDYFYQAGQTLTMPDDNVTLTAVWDIKSAGSGSTYRIPVKSAVDDQGSGKTPRYLWVTDDIGWLTWGSGSATISSSSASYSDFSYQTGSAKNTILIYSEIASVKKIRLYCYGSNAFSCNGVSTGTTYGSYSALTVSTDYTFNGNSISNSANGVIEIIFSTALAANTYVQFTFSANGKFYGVELETTGGGSGSWTNKYVAFDNNTGVVGTPTLPDTIWGVPSGKMILEPADAPTATGYTFDNWYPTQACNTAAFDWDGAITKDTTLYAKFEAPTIVMTKSGKGLISSMPGYDTLIINQSLDPVPYGASDCNISYTVGYSVSHTQLAPQPTIKYGTGAGVGHDTILMPVKDGANMYEVVAYLRTGTTRGAGDLVTTDTIRADVETSYAVKVRARVDGIDIAEERLALLYPSFAAISVTIWKEINGYELDSIDLGVGVTVKDTTERPDCYWIRYYAANASTITAVYKPKANTVYLFNADTHNYCMYAASRTKLYDYGTGGYWHTDGGTQKGAGSYGMTGDTVIATDFDSPVWMASIGGSTTSFAFTSDKLNGVEEFYSYTASNGSKLPAHVIYRTDYNATLPMFVPVAKDKDDCYIINKNGDDGQAQYYRGFWVKRSPDPDSTGYYLKVYDKVSGDPAPKLIQSVPLRLTQTGEDGTWELTATIDLEANKTYGFKFTKATGASTVVWYADTNEGTMTSAAHTGWDNFVTDDKKNTGLTTTAAGDYTFHIYCVDYGTKAANAATAAQVQGKFAVTVDYAANSGDYRVIYSDATQTEVIASPSIRPRANGQDTVSFFIRKSSASRVMKIQKFDSDWDDVSTVDLSTIEKDSVYVIYLQQNEGMTTIEVTGIDFYDGDYYIRTNCVDEHKWDYKKSLENHRMIPTDYGMTDKQPDKFSHYYVHWIGEYSNVKFIVANKYAPCLSDTVITDDWVTDGGGNLGAKGANIRFMYNKGTNVAMRAYLYGSQENDDDYLKLTKTSGSMTDRSSAITEITFTDMGNFTYQAEIAAQPGLRGKLTAKYLLTTQYFLGSSSSDEELISGSGDDFQNILLTYDFRTNRLICAWQPSGATITENLDINADIMIIRKAQGDAQQIRFASDKKIKDVHYIYGVIEFEYNDMYHMMYSWDWWSYAQCMYYISFPFDVLVNDIMGVGALGQDWRLQRYNGAKRAAEGWFKDGTQTFWEDIHAGDTLHAYEGYSLLLNRSRFNGTKGNIWDNKHAGDKVYLYFPSVSPMVGELSDQDVTVHVPSHQCTINRTFEPSSGMIVNHKITDSHWNMIGTPMFADTTAFSMDDGPTPEGESEALQYVYAWNHYGNTLGIQLTLDNKWKFKTMYSYMAQYCGDIVFKGPAVNKAVAAKRAEPKKNYHLNLEISKDEQFIGRTYVELRENAVDTFLLNEDVYMVRNGVNADLFTYAGTYEAGANVLPIANQTVQVGVAVKAAGTYVFSMPDVFDGEVILVDTYTQTRTNLAIEDYEVALTKGDIINRFYLEININNVPTAIDGVGDGEGTLKDGKAHKFIMNDQMYILQNGVIYDARGARVK